MANLRSCLKRVFLGLFTILLAGVSQLALGESSTGGTFPRPKGLEPRVEFWKKIFTEYSEYQVVLHDARYLDKIFSVLDFRTLSEKGFDRVALDNKIREAVKHERARIEEALLRIQRLSGKPGSLSEDERKIWLLYRNHTEKHAFQAARMRIRTQSGLREKFQRALVICGRYLPHLEAIFRQEGLPIELTRLPFIESSFNIDAYSKARAGGIWQFIPSSARIYNLRIDEVVDERRDPLFSTEAAVRHLRDDYALLGSWPLAITAYNHGRAGVARAVQEVGSKNIVTIIRNYRSRTFGFASQNFYAEFLAALDIYEDAEQYFGKLKQEPKVKFDEVTIRHFLPFRTLVQISGSNEDEMRNLNPAFHPQVFAGRLHVPRGYRLRVPEGKRQDFYAAYAKLSPAEQFASQPAYYVRHRVRRSQSLASIAQHYGTSVRAIQALNGIAKPRLIRIEQVLKIPSKSVTTPQSGAGESATISHRVQSGQSVETIARQYGTTVRAIQLANSLGNVEKIWPGQVLKIPAGKRATYVRHRVQSGQTLGTIANRYQTTIGVIKALNNLRNSHLIRAGQVLKIPESLP
jgi:FOG: LysM repeat